MKSRKTTEIIAGALAAVSILAMNPAEANAAWKENNRGWWYTEGSSWATGWRLIDGNWYYFYSDGYMAKDTTIGGYYVNSNGVWVESIKCNHESNVTLSGTLKKYTWRHLNTEFYPDPIPYYVLELDTPVSVVNMKYGEDESYFRNKTEIQLFGLPDNLTNKVNQRITVTGKIDVTRWTQYYQREVCLHM